MGNLTIISNLASFPPNMLWEIYSSLRKDENPSSPYVSIVEADTTLYVVRGNEKTLVCTNRDVILDSIRDSLHRYPAWTISICI